MYTGAKGQRCCTVYLVASPSSSSFLASRNRASIDCAFSSLRACIQNTSVWDSVHPKGSQWTSSIHKAPKKIDCSSVGCTNKVCTHHFGKFCPGLEDRPASINWGSRCCSRQYVQWYCVHFCFHWCAYAGPQKHKYSYTHTTHFLSRGKCGSCCPRLRQLRGVCMHMHAWYDHFTKIKTENQHARTCWPPKKWLKCDNATNEISNFMYYKYHVLIIYEYIIFK